MVGGLLCLPTIAGSVEIVVGVALAMVRVGGGMPGVDVGIDVGTGVGTGVVVLVVLAVSVDVAAYLMVGGVVCLPTVAGSVEIVVGVAEVMVRVGGGMGVDVGIYS